MDVDGIRTEVFDEHELEEAVRNTVNGIVVGGDNNEPNTNDATSEEDFVPTLSQTENDLEELSPDVDTHEFVNKELSDVKVGAGDADADEETGNATAKIHQKCSETGQSVQVRSMDELCEAEEVGESTSNGTEQITTDDPDGTDRKPSRISERKRKSKKMSDLEYDSEDVQMVASSEDEWNPEENDADPDYEDRQRKRRRMSVSRARRKRISIVSRNKRLKSTFPRASRTDPIKLKPRPTPPTLQPIEGKTPLLVIKPLQIPESLMQRTKSFVIRQQGQARIQVIPKFRTQSLHGGSRKERESTLETNSRLSSFNLLNKNGGKRNLTSFSQPHKSPIANLQQCANCNVQFTKLTPKISHFRLNGERLSASDAFNRIFQLQLQKHKKIPDITMNESVGLCSPCGQLIARIYGAVYDFTQKRSPRSYFHQVSVSALRNSSSNGSMYDMKPFASRRNASTVTDPPATCDKSTNYPTDPSPHRPVVPVMPEKLEDYSRVTALCDICGKGLTKESGLKTHLLLTHSISQEQKSRDFVCGVCGKAYFFQYLLKNHMAVHSDDKPFSCPKENCTATFKSRASLRTHRIEVHELREQGQTFDCKFCDKKYLRPRDLKDHTVARHSDQPQFECPYCHKFFQRKKNIKTHKCPDRPPASDSKQDTSLLQDADKSELQPLCPINSHEDLLLVKNSSPKLTSPELGISPEIVQALETIHEEYHQAPEPVQHIEIHDNIHYVPHVTQHEVVHTTSAFRPQPQHQHIITPGTTVQYIQPVNYTHQYSQQGNQTQALQVHQPTQIHSYRIHNLGSHPNLEGEALSVYETVNFLDILNDTRQQPPNAAGTYQTLGFTK